MSTKAMALRSGSEASSSARPDHALGFKAGASVTRIEARAKRRMSATCLRFEHRIDGERCAGGLAAPDREVGLGKVGQDIGHRAVGRDAEGGEEVRRARHVRDELGVGPDMRLVEPVGRQEEGKRMGVGAPLRGVDESRIGALGQRPLRERNGFDGDDVGLVSDRHLRFLWKYRPGGEGRRRENHRQGRAGFATLLFSASIFLSRGLSLTAILSTLRSRRGVSLASMKSDGRSGPH